eukprot:SAG31_NODE_467_length_15267_cov_13.792919_18_plen_129_part_00
MGLPIAPKYSQLLPIDPNSSNSSQFLPIDPNYSQLQRCPEIVDGTYWPNDWDVMRGKEHLKCYYLREGMQSNRMVATCCHTCMIVDHPFYEEKVCLVLDGEADDPHRFKIMKVRMMRASQAESLLAVG